MKKGILLQLTVFLAVALIVTGITVLLFNLADKASSEKELAMFRMEKEKKALEISGDASKDTGPIQTVTTCDKSQQGSLTLRAINKITGATANVNCELWQYEDGTEKVLKGETQVNGVTTLATNVPMFLDGFVMCGNDNFQSTTDRGDDFFYRKIPINGYGCAGTIVLPDVEMYNESGSPVTYFYDSNVEESTANITIGAGGSYAKASIKLEAIDNSYIGSPDFYDPDNNRYAIGLCFNESIAGTFDYIKPKNYVGTFAKPEIYNGYNMVGSCYVIDIAPVKDQGISAEIPLVFKANTDKNPGTAGGTDNSTMHVLTKCFSINDRSKWQEGFADDSVEGTDKSCGLVTTVTIYTY